MDKEQKIITWQLYEDEGYWKYSFGLKDRPVTTSPKIMTRDQAIKSFQKEVDKIKRQFGDKYDVIVVEI